MDVLGDALKILGDTEMSLRVLIERALSANQYAEVATLARIVDAVARLRGAGDVQPSTPIRNPTGPEQASDNRRHVESISATGRSKAPRSRRTKPDEFPRFERDGDKLVKIGWSKRDERVYEHRAPRDVVFLVSTAISTKVKPKAVFAMEQILPVNDSTGTEVPSYQAYLALAWLRSLGLVQRKGKEGYALADGALDNTKLQRLWTSVPDRQ
jgi:hypothetical protein